MKRTLSTFLLLLVIATMQAQSAYISASPLPEADRVADLKGAGGVLILSQHSDLAITVINAKEAGISPRGVNNKGLYEYEVVVDRKETAQPKIEVNRRGDVNRCSFTVLTKADNFRAYKIEEVERPLSLEDATASNDAILDSSLCEVVFSSTIPDLKVDYDMLRSKGVEVKTTNSAADKSIIEKSLIIPIQLLRDAKKQMEDAERALTEKQHILLDDPKASKKAKDSDWAELDALEEKAQDATDEYGALTTITVYVPGSNRMTVSIADLKPRSKKRYNVLVLRMLEEKHVSVCSGFLAEGARQYAVREYDNAQQAFRNALTAKDMPKDLAPTINTNIQQCDSCKLYERYAMAALAELQKVRNDGGTQEEVVRYASAAIEFMDKLNMYNPCDFYAERIGRLNKIIEDQPLNIKFTFVEWVSNYSGFHEGDALADVEVWVCDDVIPNVNEFRNDRRFNKLVSTQGYHRAGISDVRGQLDLSFDRKALPTGLIFRPVGTYEHGRIKTEYIDIREVMQKSEGDYQKRQFRTKLYKE